MKVEERLTKAKIKLLLSEPWFGQLSCYIQPVEDKKVKTVGVTPKGELRFNPVFIKRLSDSQIAGLLCHEILHLAFQHHLRRQNRDPKLFNIAADLKVNDAVSLDLPEGGLIPKNSSFNFGSFEIKDIDKKTTEQIYAEISRHASKVKVSSYEGDLIDQEGSEKRRDFSALEHYAREWKQRVNAANAVAKGNIPQSIQRILHELEYPTLPWIQILRQRFKLVSRERNWKKVNKKYLPWYFPGNVRDKQLRAVIAIDTSGSMSQNELTKILSEIWGLAESFRHIQFYLLTCDSEIHNEIELTNGNKKLLKKIKMQGGGGTDFRPVFEKVEKEYQNRIDCLIYFTDGYGDFPAKKPIYPVYWILTDKTREVPFGRKIILKVD